MRAAEQSAPLTKRIRDHLASAPGMYTAAEYAEKLDVPLERVRQALSMMATSSELEVERCTGIVGHRRRYGLSAEQVEQMGKRVNRPCLCCGEIFPSEGPHNRMCVTCRRLSSTTTPFDLD